MSWIYENIDCLTTPCGDITVTDENDNRCRFSVGENPYRPDQYLFYGTENEKTINTDTNYMICIDVDDLQVGARYKVRLSGCKLHYGDSDEHTTAVSGISNGYSIAIGSYDPNDDEKVSQAYAYLQKEKASQHDIRYDESKFVRYEIDMLGDCSGFVFKMLDNSEKDIKFPVAWIENNYTRFMDYYENDEYYEHYYLAAVENWTI
ncbi:MAG: hypothetical protein J1F11_08010 [Oscillospiraceae bacterium]|nr:hypothetical protein [Oscillospiraceae bacterium]